MAMIAITTANTRRTVPSDSSCAVMPPSRRSAGRWKPTRLLKIPSRLFHGNPLGVILGWTVGAREPRAGIHIRDGAVIDVAELIGLDANRPSGQFDFPTRIVFRLHGFS